jgi:hypothetical protein
MLDIIAKYLRWAAPVGLLLLFVAPAAADAIDGNWCHQDGRRLSIRGPEIVTPGGNKLAGNYDRHSFSYVVPATEPSGGQPHIMVLLSENAMRARIGAAPTGSDPAEVWTRCGPSIS